MGFYYSSAQAEKVEGKIAYRVTFRDEVGLSAIRDALSVEDDGEETEARTFQGLDGIADGRANHHLASPRVR
jgi:hypothetical protein